VLLLPQKGGLRRKKVFPKEGKSEKGSDKKTTARGGPQFLVLEKPS